MWEIGIKQQIATNTTSLCMFLCIYIWFKKVNNFLFFIFRTNRFALPKCHIHASVAVSAFTELRVRSPNGPLKTLNPVQSTSSELANE